MENFKENYARFLNCHNICEMGTKLPLTVYYKSSENQKEIKKHSSKILLVCGKIELVMRCEILRNFWRFA